VTKKYLTYLQQYSGVCGVLILWISITVAMHRAHLGLIDARPISYLGVNSVSQTLFSVSLLISAFLFVTFGYYIKRQFQVTNNFMAYFLIGQAGQVIAALSPYGMHSRYKMIHTVAAFTLAFSLPFLIQQFALSQSTSQHHRLFVFLLRIEQCAFLIGISLFIFTEGIAPLGEALPALGFHIWIIVLTYIAFRLENQHSKTYN